MASVHDGIKYDCEQCDFRATEKGSLAWHVANVHERTKYDCKQCDFKTSKKSSFVNHVANIHQRIKYDYKATAKGNLAGCSLGFFRWEVMPTYLIKVSNGFILFNVFCRT